MVVGWYEWLCVVDVGFVCEFGYFDYCGSIGIIVLYLCDFCKGCNCLWVIVKGDLWLCLFGEFGVLLCLLL